MVAKRPIVGVLLDGHQLDAVVATFLYVRQHLISKFAVLSHSTVLCAHPNMCFVDLQVLRCLTRFRMHKFVT